MKGSIGAFIVLIGYAVILFLMVRPGSNGTNLVKGVAGGTQGIISSATGGGTWASG